jgi:serine/threonine protein phosphatase PrpC
VSKQLARTKRISVYNMIRQIYKINCATDIGRFRENNEDSVLVDERLSIVVLADGMGGHNAGEVASELTTTNLIHKLSDWLETSKNQTIAKNIKKAIGRFINQTSEVIYCNSLENFHRRGMGATVVVGVFRERKLTIAHVGDSRAYLLRRGELKLLTRDHSKIQEKIDEGIITPEQALVSIDRNVLTRAVGTSPFVDADYCQFQLEVNDRVLICSDGLSDMLSESVIKEILIKDESPSSLCAYFIHRANQAGGKDNISLALCFVVEGD